MSTKDPILARFTELSQGAGAYCGEVSAAYEKFIAANDLEGWDQYCRDLQALRGS